MKIKQTIYIHHHKYVWEDKGNFEVWSFQADDDQFRTFVCSQEIEIEVPDDYDPRTQQIAALEKQKQKAMAEHQKTITDINERISKLQAISYTA
jgi:hypothetical protein